LVDLFEYMMIHGHANTKLKKKTPLVKEESFCHY